MFYTSVIKSFQKMKESKLKVTLQEKDAVEQIGKGNSVTCFLDEPTKHGNAELPKDGEQYPFLRPFLAQDAKAAILYAQSQSITKVAALGYGMFKAGLTLQADFKVYPKKGPPKRLIFCPKYMAYASLPEAPLDAMLQTVGRAFVDLKGLKAPPDWFIEFLGRPGLVDRLVGYSELEQRLAATGGERVYVAMRQGFDRTSLAEAESAGETTTFGVVGARREDIAGILGMTRTKAVEIQQKRQEAAEKKRLDEEAQRRATEDEDAVDDGADEDESFGSDDELFGE